jgi:ABC-type dipeptide/oligopeptide/nickel transport system permease component
MNATTMYRLLANLGLLLAITIVVFALLEISPGGLERAYLHSAPVAARQPFYLQ